MRRPSSLLRLRSALLSGFAMAAISAPSLGAQQPAPVGANADSMRTPCRFHPVRKQLDFWIGTWDVHPWAQPGATGPLLGTNVIEPQLDHCVLLEQWTGTRGGTGRSYNWFDSNLGNWRQLWIASNGGTLDYSQGEFRDGAMRFRGFTTGPSGQRIERRLTFFHLHADTVRQLFENSTDSGRTWTPGFDGRYIRRTAR
jgi:hypothetical protein